MWSFVFLLLHMTLTDQGEGSISPQTATIHLLNIGVQDDQFPQRKKSSITSFTSVPPTESSTDFQNEMKNYFEDKLPTSFDYSDLESSTSSPRTFNVSNSPSTKKKVNRKQYCSKRFEMMKRCLDSLPPMPDIGIPSTPQAVDAACKAFNTGMSCVEDWTKKCLPKDKVIMLKESITGAHETFTFLCRDAKFRQDFLQHGDCFRKISHQWDECSKHFIDSMRRFQNQKNMTIHCCVRLSFLHCVSGISHRYCTRDAAKFLQRMAETLVRATLKSHVPPQCVSISHKNCSAMSGSSFTFPQGPISRSVLVATFSFFILLFFGWGHG